MGGWGSPRPKSREGTRCVQNCMFTSFSKDVAEDELLGGQAHSTLAELVPYGVTDPPASHKDTSSTTLGRSVGYHPRGVRATPAPLR